MAHQNTRSTVKEILNQFYLINNNKMSQTTALQQLRIDIKESAILSKAAKIIILVFIDNKLEQEKQQLCDFWIEGNKQGWEQQTDRPQDAEKFYNRTFQAKANKVE